MQNYKDLFLELREAALVKNNLHNPINDPAQAAPMPQKPYPADAPLIALPEPDFLEDHEVSFLELIELRSSIRQYSDEPLTMKELSYLLWCTQGVKMVMPNGNTKRTVPSAGGMHAFETYLYIERVAGIKPGIYRFLAMEHALLPIYTEEDAMERLVPAFRAQAMFRGSAVTFMWVAELERMEYKFGGRALQYLYIDAGHVCQNLYLAGYTIKTGVCAVGHFYDTKLNNALGLDGRNEFVVYAAHAGKV